MTDRPTRWWHRYAPSYSSNPLKLAWTLVTEKNPAARSALIMAGAGVALSPLDFLLSFAERRVYSRAPSPNLPVILVCGPPRSGTTLVGQYLIDTLHVGYVNNLTSLFPRSPIVANRVFGRWTRRSRAGYRAFYGKSRGLGGVNDGLYLWDRWLGDDRYSVPERLNDRAGITEFFGAMQADQGQPTVNKVNRLCTCAHLVVDALPKVLIVCLRRDPVFLAQSLLVAREKLMGDMTRPYGVMHPDRIPEDPIEDVCRQVAFYQRICEEQQRRIGGERFLWIDYEAFCRDPGLLVEAVTRRFPEVQIRPDALSRTDGFTVSDRRTLDADTMTAIETRLRR